MAGMSRHADAAGGGSLQVRASGRLISAFRDHLQPMRKPAFVAISVTVQERQRAQEWRVRLIRAPYKSQASTIHNMRVRLKQLLLIKFPGIMMDCLLLTTHSLWSALTFQSR
jgi:hypothetical protein